VPWRVYLELVSDLYAEVWLGVFGEGSGSFLYVARYALHSGISRWLKGLWGRMDVVGINAHKEE